MRLQRLYALIYILRRKDLIDISLWKLSKKLNNQCCATAWKSQEPPKICNVETIYGQAVTVTVKRMMPVRQNDLQNSTFITTSTCATVSSAFIHIVLGFSKT